jgi:hypothetical protein
VGRNEKSATFANAHILYTLIPTFDYFTTSELETDLTLVESFSVRCEATDISYVDTLAICRDRSLTFPPESRKFVLLVMPAAAVERPWVSQSA